MGQTVSKMRKYNINYLYNKINANKTENENAEKQYESERGGSEMDMQEPCSMESIYIRNSMKEDCSYEKVEKSKSEKSSECKQQLRCLCLGRKYRIKIRNRKDNSNHNKKHSVAPSLLSTQENCLCDDVQLSACNHICCNSYAKVTDSVCSLNNTKINTTNMEAAAQSQIAWYAASVPSQHLTVHFWNAPIGSLTSGHVHTQVDYLHYLVPDLLAIANCSYYWGKIDRYLAEQLLEGKPEGTFLLRDSAQEEHLYSVSFRRYGRSLHARIEQWQHKFSFDSHDPGVFSASSVVALVDHYKDPSCCMFFEPLLIFPLHRITAFSLKHLCRGVIASYLKYDDVVQLPIPNSLKIYLREYHYKQKACVRRFDTFGEGTQVIAWFDRQ